ncbi:MAG: hypothetical protein Q8L34_05070, partial [Candidatus Woesearchaeota archaeon]|nr:hypothetical protein [Candidatus Woesearchaeota archaeon]
LNELPDRLSLHSNGRSMGELKDLVEAILSSQNFCLAARAPLENGREERFYRLKPINFKSAFILGIYGPDSGAGFNVRSICSDDIDHLEGLLYFYATSIRTYETIAGRINESNLGATTQRVKSVKRLFRH